MGLVLEGRNAPAVIYSSRLDKPITQTSYLQNSAYHERSTTTTLFSAQAGSIYAVLPLAWYPYCIRALLEALHDLKSTVEKEKLKYRP